MKYIKKINENWDDPYIVLGVDRKASIVDIKKAYRKIALQYHPDRNNSKEAVDIFRKATIAYKKLTDVNKTETQEPKAKTYTQPPTNSSGKRYYTQPVKKSEPNTSVLDTIGLDDLLNDLDNYLGSSNYKKNFGGGFSGLFD